MIIKTIMTCFLKFITSALARWKILSAYLVFSVLVLSGWYIDIMGVFSSEEDFAGSFRAQHGDMNLYNVLAFLTGTVFYIVFLVYDYLKLQLEKIKATSTVFKSRALNGDVNQAVVQNSPNSPALTNSSGAIINYNINGVTEERCRAICDEKLVQVLAGYTFESIDTAKERVGKFREKLVNRLRNEANGYEQFADPGFQNQLVEAQQAAASSDREGDLDLLSELLARRVNAVGDRRIQIGVKKAVEMLPFVSDDALLGLTVDFAALNLSPVTGSISKGLGVLDEIMAHLIGDSELPKGELWIEPLESCGLVKCSMGKLLSAKKFVEMISDRLVGYSLPGIKKNSDNYQKAIELLHATGLSEENLVEHELDQQYVRLEIPYRDAISNLKSVAELGNGIRATIFLNETRKKALYEVFDLYEQDKRIKDVFSGKLSSMMNGYKHLAMVMEWWDQVPVVFETTLPGRVLANANAHKIDSNIPIVVK